MKMYADLFFMNIFLQKFHRQLHFLFHRHLDNQLILHILKINHIYMYIICYYTVTVYIIHTQAVAV